MDKQELINKIIQKKEFSQLPKKDVEIVFKKFDDEKYSDEEKIKLTRDLLRKVFSVFVSQKLLNIKNKNVEWFLRKHISTRERLPYYKEIYKRLLKNFEEDFSIIDLGCGINGLSYESFDKRVNYIGVEAIGQLVNLTNDYFKKQKIKGKIFHLSLFELDKIKKLIQNKKGKKIIFLFKTIDSLEMMQRDYSKSLLNQIVPLTDKVVISFATRSLVRGKKFHANRNWILNFIKENFKVTDDFEYGDERYVVFSVRK